MVFEKRQHFLSLAQFSLPVAVFNDGRKMDQKMLLQNQFGHFLRQVSDIVSNFPKSGRKAFSLH